jgi:hypothetical protein
MVLCTAGVPVWHGRGVEAALAWSEDGALA